MCAVRMPIPVCLSVRPSVRLSVCLVCPDKWNVGTALLYVDALLYLESCHCWHAYFERWGCADTPVFMIHIEAVLQQVCFRLLVEQLPRSILVLSVC